MMSVCRYLHMNTGTLVDQRCLLDLLGTGIIGSYESHLTWVLGIELRSSGRAASVLNC